MRPLSFKTRFAAAATTTFLSLLTAVGCSDGADAVLPQDVYIWQRQWTPDLAEAVTRLPTDGTVRVLAEQWNPPDARVTVEPEWESLLRSGRPVVPVIRLQGRLQQHPRRDAWHRRAAEVVAQWRVKGLAVEALEIDHDAATRELGHYAEWLAGLRQALPADVKLVITALPSWMVSAELSILANAVDSFVLQVHAVDRPQEGLFNPQRAREWAERFAQVQPRNFALALPAYGSRVSLSDQGALLSVRSESPTLDGAGRNALELGVDPVMLAQFITDLHRRPVPGLKALAWFRLPLPHDQRAWSPTTWAAVVRGQPLVSDIRVRPSPTQTAGVFELWLENVGSLDSLPPLEIIAAPACSAADGGAAYHARSHLQPLRWQRAQSLPLKAGARLRLGWVRCPSVNPGDFDARS